MAHMVFAALEHQLLEALGTLQPLVTARLVTLLESCSIYIKPVRRTQAKVIRLVIITRAQCFQTSWPKALRTPMICVPFGSR